MNKLLTNTSSLQTILETINNLPNASELPELTTPASAEEVFAGKEVINQEGEVQIGTFTIATELSEQDELLSELEAVLENKAIGGGTSGSEVEDNIISRTIASYENNRVKSIGNNAFDSCSNLTTASFPACTSIGNYAFNYCVNLTAISFPVCVNFGSGAFYGCCNLTTVLFPECEYISTYTFANCSNLTAVSLSKCISINNFAFMYCKKLSSLTLGASTVCSLPYSLAFYDTPFRGDNSYFSGTPYIYVPASLIDAYKSATNWAYYSSYFSTIESLESGN